jgi:hypothetical protein
MMQRKERDQELRKKHEKEIVDLKSKLQNWKDDERKTRQIARQRFPKHKSNKSLVVELTGNFLERYEFGSPTDFLETRPFGCFPATR